MKLFVLSLLVFNFSLLANVKIDVKLTTFDSFEIKSSQVSGSVQKSSDGSYIAKNIKVPVKSLSSGMELRDKHIHERLGSEDVTILLAKGREGKGVAKVKINGVTEKVAFKYKINGAKADIDMILHLPKFKIKDIRYMGIGVEDDVKILASVPVR